MADIFHLYADCPAYVDFREPSKIPSSIEIYIDLPEESAGHDQALATGQHPLHGKQPPFFVASAATGDSLITRYYNTQKGWVYHLANNYGEGLFIAFNRPIRHGRVHYNYYTRQSPTLPPMPPKQNVVGHFDVYVQDHPDYHLQNMEIAERVRHKLTHGLRAHVTVPGTIDLCRRFRSRRTKELSKKQWSEFCSAIKRQNSHFKFQVAALGVVRDYYTRQVRQMLSSKTTEMAAMLAVILDFHGLTMDENKFNLFLACCAANDIEVPGVEDALTAYHHHHAVCHEPKYSSMALRLKHNVSRSENHQHSPGTLKAALEMIKLLPRFEPASDHEDIMTFQVAPPPASNQPRFRESADEAGHEFEFTIYIEPDFTVVPSETNGKDRHYVSMNRTSSKTSPSRKSCATAPEAAQPQHEQQQQQHQQQRQQQHKQQQQPRLQQSSRSKRPATNKPESVHLNRSGPPKPTLVRTVSDRKQTDSIIVVDNRSPCTNQEHGSPCLPIRQPRIMFPFSHDEMDRRRSPIRASRSPSPSTPPLRPPPRKTKRQQQPKVWQRILARHGSDVHHIPTDDYRRRTWRYLF